jgi:SRSO17 transposase
MDANDLRPLLPELERFLGRFDDCFLNPATTAHLPIYICGQLSDLDRKSVEPIAKRADVPPRTLQEFLSFHAWDHAKMRDQLQHIVAAEHTGPNSIGIVDETSFVKKGTRTPGVQRQWCGTLGKVENCVVTVHLGYFRSDFQALLDGDLFLPESWSDDRARCRKAGIPDDVVHRPKWQIALEQYDRARTNGITFDWLTFDEAYGSVPDFLRGLDQRNQKYVGEVRKNLMGWLEEPPVTARPYGRRTQPRLISGSPDARRFDELLKDPKLAEQPWTLYRLDDRQQGPSVWKAKHVRVWIKDEQGLPTPLHLVVVQHVLCNNEVKFFLSNALVDTPVEQLLLVGLTRHRVERCFQDQKGELGLSHFEGRTYKGLMRHVTISCVSYLFLVRAVLSRAEKKSGVDGVPDPQGVVGPDHLQVVNGLRSGQTAGPAGQGTQDHPDAQRSSTEVSRQTHSPTAPQKRHPPQRRPALCLA